ncbi:membrane-spanning 4-domains subfamily A member 15-like [Hypanus sabinus]|uniref:membrane-spanning 4-domains subfamily A member 15-like n=1 Tax=Hypanus sabinus TaxID=79690 RepID=UPI0028C4EF54|nr:membrane-spanning 4-domains subfamily A member 15-like [Hypanus sabinus]XP_059819170.1 membrane-spanning 4-domains subfamily A member 15-like [Hypanus sabinus]
MSTKVLSKELSSIGVAQVMLGFIQLTFGIPWYYVARDLSGHDAVTPFWTGIWYIISGGLTTEIKNLSNAFKVKVVLGTNVISGLVAGVGIIAYSLSFYHRKWNHWGYRPTAQVAFVLLLQMFTVAELVLAVISAVLIARYFFRCCNLNAVSVS